MELAHLAIVIVISSMSYFAISGVLGLGPKHLYASAFTRSTCWPTVMVSFGFRVSPRLSSCSWPVVHSGFSVLG